MEVVAMDRERMCWIKGLDDTTMFEKVQRALKEMKGGWMSCSV